MDLPFRVIGFQGNNCPLPLNACPADVFPNPGDHVVNIDDLLAIIAQWGSNQPIGPRPSSDCAPLPTGDCSVNIDDLLAVINSWGDCPQAVGPCCISGACAVLTSAACADSGGLYMGDGLACEHMACPLPKANGLCGNAAIAQVGLNHWDNEIADTDGPLLGECESQFGRDVWFEIVSPVTGLMASRTFSIAVPDTVLAVYDGISCSPETLLACNDDGELLGWPGQSQVFVQVQVGQSLLIRVGSKQTTLGGVGAVHVQFFDQASLDEPTTALRRNKMPERQTH
jgi:hypothetical protein